MAIRKQNFFQRYRKVILFNKNLILSGVISFLAGALTTQIYALFDSNNLSNALITLLIGYCVYIPLFAFLFYRDNKSRYVDPLTGKKLFPATIICSTISGSHISRINSLGSISYFNKHWYQSCKAVQMID
ncbi:MAG: hypothetical protein FIO04_02415 [Nitrosopumilales archaeon]|nr:hypothetical protein [Nitrosopumilales archaeon]